MKLELFSGEVGEESRPELGEFFKLNKDKMQILLDGMLERARSRGYPSSWDKQLAERLGVDDSTLTNLMYTGLLVVSRILSGKAQAEVEKDLVANNFPEETVNSLFSRLRAMSDQNKEILRNWTLAQQLDAVHLISFDVETNVRSVVDNGVVVAIGPVSVLRMAAHRLGQKTQRILMELTLGDLDEIMKDLQTAKSEHETAIKELKARLGELKVVRG